MVAGKSQITPVATVMARQCCSKKCVSRVAIAAGTTARSSFDAQSGQAQRQWLLSYLLDHHQQRDGYTEYIYLIGTERVCCTAWRDVHGITKTRFFQIKKSFEGETFCFDYEIKGVAGGGEGWVGGWLLSVS